MEPSTIKEGHMAILSSILDVLPDSFLTRGTASTLDLARGNSFLRAHPWLLFAGIGLACFVAAAIKPANFAGHSVSHRVSALIWGVLGVILLIFAVLFAVGLVRL
jgi:hypothetical protein